MHTISEYQEFIATYLQEQLHIREPKNLYDPITYILQLGGKRLRPALTLLSAEIFNKSYQEAFPAALSIEVFHNFSLVHDDIMDQAPLRRGAVTVHEKWNINTGILSGDAMLILAYRYFESYAPHIFKALVTLFSQTALEVCEGQQWDIDFETRSDVSLSEYLKMIEYKTAVLIAAAMKMGAIVAETTIENQNLIYDFGRNLGLAFQLQDDYLDAFGDPKVFGKQLGGDIIANKKTYLYLKAMEFASVQEQQQLKQLASLTTTDTTEKVAQVKAIFTTTGAAAANTKAIETYTSRAFEILEKITIDSDKKAMLKSFGEKLMYRTL